ncbi:uncharacterized protein lhfpl7 isoform X2 [Oryzias latipes]
MLSREKKKEEEAGFALDLGFLPHAASMFSCVGCFWVLLSSALVAVCSFSFISPAWIVKETPRSGHQHPHPHDKGSVSFGLLWHCSESLDRMYRCYTFGGLGRFAEIPSSSWQVVVQVALSDPAGKQLPETVDELETGQLRRECSEIHQIKSPENVLSLCGLSSHCTGSHTPANTGQSTTCEPNCVFKAS